MNGGKALRVLQLLKLSLPKHVMQAAQDEIRDGVLRPPFASREFNRGEMPAKADKTRGVP